MPVNTENVCRKGKIDMIIQIAPKNGNSTADVVSALEEIKKVGGGEIHFEKGEYHFYAPGTHKEFFAVSNNTACDKNIVFPIINMENLVIDGHNSNFVFHDVVFPFMISKSKNITVRNVLIDTGKSPLVEFRIHHKTDDGFYMDIDKEENPFHIDEGSLCFERESEVVSGKDRFLSLHAVGVHRVQYFATGDCKANMTNLPAPLMKCIATETANGIYARYCEDSPSECRFGEDVVTAIVDGGRNVDVFCLDKSENVAICNVTVARGIGMGVVGQISRDILIDGFSTDIDYHPGSYQTLTADSLHFINCDGKLEIKNCRISDTMDDVVNIHGMYTVVRGAEEGRLRAEIMHREQHFFNPYRKGDRLEIIDDTTFEVVSEFVVADAYFKDGSGTDIIIEGKFTYGKEKARDNFRIENPDRMPNVHMHHNEFSNFPHIRMSGAGEMLVEENHFSNCEAALLCLDLAPFWYESGRVKHLVYRKNIMDNCNGQGKEEFIRIGIDGIDDEKAPQIHEKIEIIGNKFINIKKYAVRAAGVKELVFKDNIFDRKYDDVIKAYKPKALFN